MSNGANAETWTSGFRSHPDSSFVVEPIDHSQINPEIEDILSCPTITSNHFASRRSFASQKSEVSQKSFASQKSQGAQGAAPVQTPHASHTLEAPPTSHAAQTQNESRTLDASQTTAASQNPGTPPVFPAATGGISTTPASPSIVLHSSAPASQGSAVPLATHTTLDVSTTSILPSPTLESVFPTRTPGARLNPSSKKSAVGTLVPAIIVPAVLILVILFILVFLRRHRKRRRGARSSPPPYAMRVSEDNITPFPVPVATSNPFSEQPSGSDSNPTTTMSSATISPLKSKSAYDIPQAVPAESVSSTALPVTMSELTEAMQRAGLSVTGLMSSLDRVTRVNGLNDREGMPPHYEP